MPTESPRRSLQPGDLLLRKVAPDQWHASPYHAGPEAFAPREDGLSLFSARLSSPHKVLGFFVRFRSVWRQVGQNRPPTVSEMVQAGYRVAEIDAKTLLDLGVSIRQTEDGYDCRPDGHVDVLGCEWLIEDLSQASRLLTPEECLSKASQDG